ncbi:hypothetical protein ABB37_04925 [Leptomonas pyrrhocoris]|uniref:Uncharacterized protein n=1 Tax=Leptomonas pyrrhocoris TaxID=157538 RepID=A0A0M9G0R8_LEPPY|nr:hypothetical protein ABB37_04925 [Leptomonas pyrrhocoris]XP_015658278.1 hypothetical protein ABB37_04925 [Leptomonas pyrrhocoris]XP_015658279.1 hypothetical protein ABB37_04925 [Leptomonas pyrrhocoris]KPA79838.1 hypothetical protein ABB37_04925 [Leptomonas pyrrhocoris]KPA79839.1 hypothetical protein ABB37_04925 [Leptomonas pyrrhocoris]KPA79840.1 hypothetical protein ABB37_04925 [Leptomonas pyrrhocoris]|eukprot:XP_015658277.1 hypothetical protein ABB37_04925 [Leptomonas pyrrhocoris]
MGNTNSSSHRRANSRRVGSTAGHGTARERRCNSCIVASSATHPSRIPTTCNQQKPTVRRTVSSTLPVRTEGTQLRRHFSTPAAPASAFREADRRLNASLVTQNGLLMKSESGSSNDTLTEDFRGAEALSEMTLDTNSSCPLVGPRNITTQFEQTSEVPKSMSYVLASDVHQSDKVLQRQSSGAGEVECEESFEERLTHSIAIVEEWLVCQENVLNTA